MKKLKQNKGFTLAELLVVVAIIGVLVAVAIPIFTGQLEKSRDAVTVANLRSAYAEAQTAYMTEKSSRNAKYIPAGGVITKIRTVTTKVDTVEVSGVVAQGEKDNYFSELAKSLPFNKKMEGCKEMDYDHGTYTVIFEYETNGEIIRVRCEEGKDKEINNNDTSVIDQITEKVTAMEWLDLINVNNIYINIDVGLLLKDKTGIYVRHSKHLGQMNFKGKSLADMAKEYPDKFTKIDDNTTVYDDNSLHGKTLKLGMIGKGQDGNYYVYYGVEGKYNPSLNKITDTNNSYVDSWVKINNGTNYQQNKNYKIDNSVS